MQTITILHRIFLFSIILFSNSASQSKVRLGCDVLIARHLDHVEGKRVGLITNHTGRLSSGEMLLDVLIAKQINVTALFGPEHGIRGEAAAGEGVSDMRDETTGIPIFSLYGKSRKPTPDMLANVDVLIYDIQDVAARFYTYISTMGLCMEAAAERGIPFIVLDRPNPLGGMMMDGPIREDAFKSFVGMYPIPVVYGLTCGELATMINEEGWLDGGAKCELQVIRMEGWKRKMLWDDTGLKWTAPSPNIRTSAAALVYPATCFIEATNLSEGRGTAKPFQYIGAPFIDAEELREALHRLNLNGVTFAPVSFTPTSSKHAGTLCRGVAVEVTEPRTFQPIVTGVSIIREIRKLYPSQATINKSSFLRLMGSTAIYESLMSDKEIVGLQASLSKEVAEFRMRARRFMVYE